jgi:hypothetical protein
MKKKVAAVMLICLLFLGTAVAALEWDDTPKDKK